ncbi:hypothetical protein F5Y13DRAFT_164208 [Hypoxylon sp. FL1857]|nr:hypothetical protein F5Y13DRAFT_164208 [Hypoxylon sp. FL1857]
MHILGSLIVAAGLPSLVSATAPYRRACNPAEIQPGPFQLVAFDSVTNKSTGLTITLASRGVPILSPTADGSLDGALNFTFDADQGRLKPFGYSSSDDARVGDSLTFGAFNHEGNGGISQKAVKGCFEGNRTPMFLVVGDADISDEQVRTGWNICGRFGIFWNGDKAPQGNCTGTGVQVVLLDGAE